MIGIGGSTADVFANFSSLLRHRLTRYGTYTLCCTSPYGFSALHKEALSCYNKSMKKLLLLLVAVILLGVLAIVYLPLTPNEPSPMLGADRDAHGCIASAGYTYSVVRGGCIRVWEDGTALSPVDAEVDGPTLAAYVVQGDNGKEAEVFFPGFSQGLVLTRSDEGSLPTWTAAGIWKLTYGPDQGWKLEQGGKILFAGGEKLA